MSTLPHFPAFPMKVIGFSGLINSGKTTAAEILVQHRGARRWSFADPLRGMLKTLLMCHYPEDQAENFLRREKTVPLRPFGEKTARYLLQTLGTGWGRNMIMFNVWSETMRGRLESVRDQRITIVVDDVRYQNEADVIKSMGGKIVRIDWEAAIPPTHDSDSQIIESDAVVSNNGSMADFEQSIIAAFDFFFNGVS
jgi:hypothetical protein